MSDTDPRITVAQNLTAIVELSERLEDQAINDANDHLMPGGLAMVALASVSNLEAWSHRVDSAERRGLQLVIDDDDEWEPPLQTLLFWSEDLRRTHDMEFAPEPHRPYPTITTEANIVRHHVDWLWDNEPHFDDMAEDIRLARGRLESLLTEGLRVRRGVPCLSLECENSILIRPVAPRRDPSWCDGHDGVCNVPHETCPHDRGGLRDEWTCPKCLRRYGMEDYIRAVSHAAFLNAEWLPLEGVIARTGVTRGSVQGWASKGEIRKRKDVDSGRMTYNVPDIETRRDRVVA